MRIDNKYEMLADDQESDPAMTYQMINIPEDLLGDPAVLLLPSHEAYPHKSRGRRRLHRVGECRPAVGILGIDKFLRTEKLVWRRAGELWLVTLHIDMHSIALKQPSYNGLDRARIDLLTPLS